MDVIGVYRVFFGVMWAAGILLALVRPLRVFDGRWLVKLGWVTACILLGPLGSGIYLAAIEFPNKFRVPPKKTPSDAEAASARA